MNFEDFYSKLQESESEDTRISLGSWNLLCKFRDSNLPLCVTFITQLLNNTEVNEHIKGLAMILFKKLQNRTKKVPLQEIPQEILSNFYTSLLSLFEFESLQLVSIAASIVFIISSNEIKDNNNISLISGYADNLQKSSNPYAVFGYCCLLFDLCQEFSLPIEILFLVVSAIFQQLSTGQLPPVVASRCIALFSSTVSNFSKEFTTSQLFSDVLKMLVELTNMPGTETESFLAWAVIISTCQQFSVDILESIGGISIQNMQESEDEAILIATCVFWADTARTFAKSTTNLIAYAEPLLHGLFRLLCIRGGDQNHEDFGELQQAAAHTLKTFTKYTPFTSAPFIADIVREYAESTELAEANATLIFSRVLANADISSLDVPLVSNLISNCLQSGVHILLYNAISCLRALIYSLQDASVLSELVSTVFEIIEQPLETTVRCRIAMLMSAVALTPELECQIQACDIILQYAKSSDTIISAAAFHALSEITNDNELSREEYCLTILPVHTYIVPELLTFIEECTAEGIQQIENINDICNKILTPLISLMEDKYEQFVERTIAAMMEVLAETSSVYKPLSIIASTNTALFEDCIETFIQTLVEAFQSGVDVRIADAADCFFNVASTYDLEEVIPTVVECLLGILSSCERPFYVLKSCTELTIELRNAGAEIPLGDFVGTIPALIESFENARFDGDSDIGLIATRYIEYISAIITDCSAEEKESAIEAGCALTERTCTVCNQCDTDFEGAILVFLNALISTDPSIAQTFFEQNENVQKVIFSTRALKYHAELLAQVSGAIQIEPISQ